MNVQEAVISRRAVRAFLPKPIERTVLEQLCETARLYASSGNRQPIRFQIIQGDKLCADVFNHTHWAAYLKNYEIPPQQRPKAYILLVADTQINANPQFDAGAAATSIMLLAKEQGMDTCCIGSFERSAVAELLNLDMTKYVPLYLLAIGYSDQENRTEPAEDTIVYRYENNQFVVPKYDIKKLLL